MADREPHCRNSTGEELRLIPEAVLLQAKPCSQDVGNQFIRNVTNKLMRAATTDPGVSHIETDEELRSTVEGALKQKPDLLGFWISKPYKDVQMRRMIEIGRAYLGHN